MTKRVYSEQLSFVNSTTSSVSSFSPPSQHYMSAYKISKLKSKDAITRIKSFFFTNNWNDVSCLITFISDLFQQFDINREIISYNHQLDQLVISRILNMDIPAITDDHGRSFLLFIFNPKKT
jgi:hypothetical protein